jgi:SRSO17 transposase
MSKTYNPELSPEVLDRLGDYADIFRDDFTHTKRAAWSGVYLRGLLQDGERKSIEPLSARVALPPGLDAKDPEQALQQFVNQSPWDDQVLAVRYRRHMAATYASPQGIFVFDDTSFPKQGKHSVGVQRQYCGALGKKANCQVAPSVHYVSPEGHYPLAMRLFLPDSWLGDRDRLDRVGVPGSPVGPGPRARSPRSCSTSYSPRGCREGWPWPTPATAPRRGSAPGWSRGG